ncbi:kelch-like ECH-associated protein 1 [Coccinella septempunctata]|uniref:kelch-like ECH-associated protein 1 n=1 Tax=Coccinella septempunctata TaxID=41139 RepID=UPI001D0885A7|nr:kelch-like ECH-associated protein 1 [Coccinella septempunctata]XP_044754366.1 kelch-like ECH-associated protein 1 [Coccinella septempunctata]
MKMDKEDKFLVQCTSGQCDNAELEFQMIGYIKEAMKAMELMRFHQMLTDVVLEVGTEKFHAHRVVLAAASPYFKAMFTGGLKECDNKTVKLEGVSPTAMKILIHFIYTGKMKVTENIVCQLLPAAAMFQVTNVIEACCDFLEKQLDPSNAIGIANFAENHGCLSLYRKANTYIERHFREVAQEEEFFQLNSSELIRLIRKDELNVQEEKEVYNAVLKWVEYNPNRQNEMEIILSAVRCQFLPPKFLNDQMKNCEFIKKAPACKEYLAKIFKDLTLHKRTKEKERTPCIPRVIYVTGGYLRQSLDIVEGFNVDNKTWKKMDSLTIPRSGLGGAFLKGMFYAVGGRNTSPTQSYDSDWVERYNPVKDQWRVCSPMSVPRNRVGVAVMDGLLYAVGGSEGSKYLNSVECYDPDTDKWAPVKSMHYNRLALGVAVVNRLLYAIGGYDGTNRHNSAECYHPENDEWTMINPMHIPRSGAGVAAINQYIFVIGGYDGTRQLNQVERYDTEKGEWMFVAPMKKARSALSVTVLDCKIYAIGGYDGSNFSNSVEIYDPIKNEWTDGVCLTAGRSGHASAVCYQPPSTLPGCR